MGSIHPDIIAWFQDHDCGNLTNFEPVGGGCIHETFLIQVESGDRYFLKQNNQTTADIFEKEAKGLNALRVHGGPVVPQVFLVGAEYLLLEDLQPKSRCEDYWQLLGRQLAQVHNQLNESFGYQEDNYIGSNPQLNAWMQNGPDFFRERRIKPQMRTAQKKALLKPIRSHNDNPAINELEEELLMLTNMTGIGPMGLGGDPTVLGVNIEYAHRHPASLPVGIATQCWAARRATAKISTDGRVEYITHITNV